MFDNVGILFCAITIIIKDIVSNQTVLTDFARMFEIRGRLIVNVSLVFSCVFVILVLLGV